MPAILLIEDDSTSQELIRGVCEGAGYEVDAAADGFGALKLMRERSYAAALVDYHLPEMDGCALARLLRDVERDDSERLRLIGITVDRNGLAARRGADALFDTILAKPFEPAALLATLAELVGSGPLTTSGAAEIFLASPTRENARAAADAFWRSRGLAGAPRAFGRPRPTAEQARALALCFDLVDDAATADLVVLLTPSASGGPEIGAETKGVDSIPIVDLSETGRPDCQAAFQVDDPRSWDDVAAAVLRSRRPRTEVAPSASVGAKSGDLEGAAALVDASPGGEDEVQLDLGLSVARILLIGDVAFGEGCPRAVLERAGHRVESAPNGPEALLRVAAGDLDLVLVAVPSPVKDGLTTARRIRMLAAGRADVLPLVAVTSALGPDDRLLVDGGEFTGHIERTASLAALVRAVEGWTAEHPSAAHEESPPALDTDAFERIGRLIGPDRARSLAASLAAQLNGWRVAAPATPDERERLAQDAHKMISAAGLLGFTPLSDACRGLEETALKADDLRPAIARLDSARRAATAAISGLKTAA